MRVPPVVNEVLRTSGHPLDSASRNFIEPIFDYDFSRVRLHTDSRAAESAKAVDAHAYTVGRDIVFAAGHYQPNSSAGIRLLAHELTHVVQQNDSANQSLQNLEIGPSNDSAEREAQSIASQVISGSRASVTERFTTGVRRAAAGATASQPATAPQPAKCSGVGGSLCTILGNLKALQNNPDFCQDTASTGKLHPGFTCFREIPKSPGCPPGKHICFKDGQCDSCETHVDQTAPSLKRKGKDCDISYLGWCSILHGLKDVVPWKKVGIGAGIGGAFGALFGGLAGGGAGAGIGLGVGALAGGILGGISKD